MQMAVEIVNSSTLLVECGETRREGYLVNPLRHLVADEFLADLFRDAELGPALGGRPHRAPLRLGYRRVERELGVFVIQEAQRQERIDERRINLSVERLVLAAILACLVVSGRNGLF